MIIIIPISEFVNGHRYGFRYFVTMHKCGGTKMSNLYKTIEELCQNKSISIAEMCRGAGVRQTNISDLKNGRQSGLSAKNLDKIASYFGVSVSFLLGTETEKAPGTEAEGELLEYLEELRTRPEMKMLFHTFKGATKEQIEAIVTAWEAMNEAGKG